MRLDKTTISANAAGFLVIEHPANRATPGNSGANAIRAVLAVSGVPPVNAVLSFFRYFRFGRFVVFPVLVRNQLFLEKPGCMAGRLSVRTQGSFVRRANKGDGDLYCGHTSPKRK